MPRARTSRSAQSLRRTATCLLLVLACVLCDGARAKVAAPADEPPRRILILHGNDPWLPAVVAQDQGFRRVILRELGHAVDIATEFFDNARYDAAAVESSFVELLRRKHAAGRFDLVVTVGRFGLDFVERHRTTLWPGVPIVFFGLAPEQVRGRTLPPSSTGVLTWVDQGGTLALARRLQPDARELVIVGGTAAIDQVRVRRLVETAAREQPALRVRRLDDKPFEQMLRELALLPPDAFVFYTTLFRDAAGVRFNAAEVVERIAAASAVPVYSNLGHYLGRGIVGGQLNDHAAEGERAGQLAVAVLRGKVAADAPVLEPKISACLFDARQLARFGLRDSRLPSGCTVAYAPHSLWLEHRWELFAGLGLIALQGVLIVTLLRQRRRTRLAAAEAQAARAELAHAARLATVGELTAAISHEINQPLGAVQSNADAAEMLLESAEPRIDRVRDILADIRAANLRASEVVQRLRALLVKDEHRAEAVDAAAVVDAVSRLVQSEAARRRVAIDCDIATRPIIVRGDPVQLQQVLLNLLMNAMDAVAENDVDRRRVQVRLVCPDDRHARLEVADLGFGIPPLAIPQLFRSFYSTKKGGMGLGLSITRTIVHAHGGRIEAANNADGGATFSVTLPLAPAHAASTNRQQERPDLLGHARQA